MCVVVVVGSGSLEGIDGMCVVVGGSGCLEGIDGMCV